MSMKSIVFFLGCAAAWFILLPLFIVGGGLCLLVYAVSSEAAAMLRHDARLGIDQSSAREAARLVCLRS